MAGGARIVEFLMQQQQRLQFVGFSAGTKFEGSPARLVTNQQASSGRETQERLAQPSMHTEHTRPRTHWTGIDCIGQQRGRDAHYNLIKKINNESVSYSLSEYTHQGQGRSPTSPLSHMILQPRPSPESSPLKQKASFLRLNVFRQLQ